MGVLDKDYIIYNRIQKGAMRTLIKQINESEFIESPITEEEIENDPKLMKRITHDLTQGFRDLMRKGDNIRFCINWEDLNEYRKDYT